jgi:hypothetical protein
LKEQTHFLDGIIVNSGDRNMAVVVVGGLEVYNGFLGAR